MFYESAPVGSISNTPARHTARVLLNLDQQRFLLRSHDQASPGGRDYPGLGKLYGRVVDIISEPHNGQELYTSTYY